MLRATGGSIKESISSMSNESSPGRLKDLNQTRWRRWWFL